MTQVWVSGGKGAPEMQEYGPNMEQHPSRGKGTPFSAQRFCPSVNCAGDVFLNVTKAVP